MSTTKQMSLMEMINRLSAGIEDDELFCQEEFEMVRNYCEQKSFMMSAADLSTIRRIGLMDRFESWKEEHRLYGLTFDQARKRKDYSFTLNELPSLIDDLQKDYMSATCENGDPYRGVAVLEVGYAQYYTINDAIRLDFETKQVTRVIEIPEEEAYGAFDMERETPVFSPRFR